MHLNPALCRDIFHFKALAIPIIPQTIAVVSSEGKTHLNWFQGLILGLVQGVTEFLPISSTAHLKVVPVILGWGDPGVSFTAIIQLGSIAAVLWYFWADLSQLIRGTWQAYQDQDWQAHDFRVSLGILIGTLPILVCGIGIKVFIEDFDRSPLRSLPAIAIVSVVMALVLGVAEQWGHRRKSFEELTMKDGIWMGCAQALALIPGVSRSGSTLTAGLFQGLQRAAAARFSFLLGIPAITIAGLVELKDLWETQITAEEWTPLVMGLISATVFSYLSIAWLLRYLQTQNTWIFIAYRLAFGVAIGIYVWQS